MPHSAEICPHARAIWRIHSWLHQSLDILANVDGLEGLGVPLDRPSVFVDEKLFKVPGNVWPLYGLPDDELWIGHESDWVVGGRRKAGLEPGKERMLSGAVDQNLKCTYIWIKKTHLTAHRQPQPLPCRTWCILVRIRFQAWQTWGSWGSPGRWSSPDDRTGCWEMPGSPENRKGVGKLWCWISLFLSLYFTSFSPNFSHSWFICRKSLVVVPHKEAVFRIRTTLPRSWENLNYGKMEIRCISSMKTQKLVQNVCRYFCLDLCTHTFLEPLT